MRAHVWASDALIAKTVQAQVPRWHVSPDWHASAAQQGSPFPPQAISTHRRPVP
jgi:hypothetical protein